MSAVREHVPVPPHHKVRAGTHAHPPGEDRDVLRHALADAIIHRAMAAAEPCPGCTAHPALLCAAHAAELDWVSAYRALLTAMP